MAACAPLTSGETSRARRVSDPLYLNWSAWQPEAFGPWDLTDEALASAQEAIVHDMRRAHRFGNEDGVRASYAEWCVGYDEVVLRAYLRDQYEARADGTDLYDEYARLGEPPSYWLATLLATTGLGHHRVICEAA